ncbi:MAG TPA: NUDIX hydrolase [Terrimesophilobacter sp.]|nr:NUDIX hydrolase [Terrimesophilobacter sp.]
MGAHDHVLAAGTVLWRGKKNKLHVLLVHRDKRNDVSLPKGKVDPGESLPHAAVRETYEETGLDIVLGAPLGTTEYTDHADRPKTVHYWSAHVDDHTHKHSSFEPNTEISALEWLPMKKARAALTYSRDKEVLDRFAELASRGHHETFAIIALRHAKAVPAGNWDGPDTTRPLLHRGLEQAVSAASAAAAFGPERLYSSTAARCQATVAPLAELTELPVTLKEGVSQDAYYTGKNRVTSFVAKRLAAKRTSVVCSHGPVLPDILAEVAHQSGADITREVQRAAMLSTGEFTVAHVARGDSEGRLVALETHAPVV